jgi:alpha/beta superfamily hydrolase
LLGSTSCWPSSVIKRDRGSGQNADERGEAAEAAFEAPQRPRSSHEHVVVTRPVTSEPVQIRGPVGPLEAAVDLATDSPVAVAVLCHPHPLHQGTMQNKVVTTLSRAFAHQGAAAVRFNFRGVGSSAGSYADGMGERDDALAVVDWSRARWPGARVYLGGFSFGAATALAIAARAEPQGLVTVAPPVARLPQDFTAPRCRWLLIHGGADEVVPMEPVVAWARGLERPPEVLVLDGVGHYFHGHLRALTDAVTAFFGAELGA